ncbi:hypothetical protein GCM10010430_44100 [Kitasatospora cystarginea]|uniref:Uncharacterized protein n=1 Tax=Kitasatospora cystarginea TaxID=58350 RepID=A0ABN3EDM8_9ACTN
MRPRETAARLPAGASFPHRPVWVPAHTIRLYCGRDFEALRCNEEEADKVLAAIAPNCGPVITSALGYSDLLLPPGEHFRQDVPRADGVRMMPPGTQIDVPPLTATSADGLYWRVRPGVGSTSLAAVAVALRPPAVPRPQTGPAIPPSPHLSPLLGPIARRIT